MVNSGSFETASEGDTKSEYTQHETNATTKATSPRHLIDSCGQEDANYAATTAEMVSEEKLSPQETANSASESPTDTLTALSSPTETKTSLQCSVPLYKVKDVLQTDVTNMIIDKLKKPEDNQKSPKRLLCLFCDRTFISLNLKQKHMDRCHSGGISRRFSSRTPGISQSATACWYCSKLNHTDHSLNQLLEHLVNDHSNRYFACLTCEERFTSVAKLKEHNKNIHKFVDENSSENLSDAVEVKEEKLDDSKDNSSPETTSRSSSRRRTANKSPKMDSIEPKSEVVDFEDSIQTNVINSKDIVKTDSDEDSEEPLKRNSASKNNKSSKKVSVKSTKNGVKNNVRTTRSQVKLLAKNKKRQKSNKEPINDSEPEKPKSSSAYNSTSVFSLVNLFTYKYEKIYDHASDSIKDANSGKFDAIFDKEFYVKTVSNIKENLLYHLDGKLNRNVQSENRISNFEQAPTEPGTKTPSASSDNNFGSDVTLNAVTPVAALPGNSSYENFDIQIEYASKATKKTGKKDKKLKYNFQTRKFNTTRRDKTESDLTNLDMWTQLRIRERQRLTCSDADNLPISHLNVSAQRDDLNTILDKRGPFDDLRTEALEDSIKSKNSDDKLNSYRDVNIILEEILSNVFKTDENRRNSPLLDPGLKRDNENDSDLDVPNYLNLQKSPNKNEVKIDVTDKPTMICIAQDSENQNVELTGEWARPRIYICATCALKLPNLKALEEHKNISHPHIWCTHYEFVGRQSQYYRHLGIPGLGKVGVVEMTPANKLWVRSDARTCSKCAKQCHNLGELHRHILECGGDWQWMLARKKCKYRPYGAKRRRQRGYKRICNPDIPRARRGPRPKTAQVGPRPKPSDAETIQRMLANLPAKRNRKMISMRDGIQGPRKQYMKRSNLRSTSTLHSENAMKVNSQSQRILRTRISHATNQALKNSLKRKINVRVLRSRSAILKQHEEKETSEDEATDKDRRTSTRKRIPTRTFNRVLGSKILDNNSTLVSRRQLVKSVIQNTLRTRLRSQLEEKLTQETEKRRTLRNRNEKTEEFRESNKKEATKSSTEDIPLETKEQKGDKNKKSVGKRLLSLVTSKSKKLKTEAKKSDTKEDPAKTKQEEPEKPRKKLKSDPIKNSPKSKKPQASKPPKAEVAYEYNNLSAIIDSVATNSMSHYDPSRLANYIRKKASNLVKNVKNLNKNPEKPNKIHNKLTEKSVATKIIRTLSMRTSKRKKETTTTVVKTDEKLDVNVCDTTLAKNEDASKKNSDDTQIPKNQESAEDASSVDCESDKNESEAQICQNLDKSKSQGSDISSNNSDDSETMPTLEKIDVEPPKLPLEDSIPILSPIYTSVLPKNSPDPNTSKKIDFSDFDAPKIESSDQNIVLEAQNIDSTNSRNENDEKDAASNDVIPEAKNDTLAQTSEAKQCSTLTKLKNKFKRSGKGLNDCIAMLKNKLEKITEPVIVDKSNLFILNASENRGPVICENNKQVEENTIKVEKTPNDCDPSVKSEKEPKNNNKLELKTVLEIPHFTKQLVPAIVEKPILKSPEFISDLNINAQLTSVLDVAMKNCLLECVKTKCEELKNGATNKKSEKAKPVRKIGSIRKRKTAKQEIEPANKIELPKSLNDAFIANETAKKTDSDDDDVPLSSLCNSPILKDKIIKKKRKTKSKISFDPIILNQQESKTPDINLEHKINVDNLPNKKITIEENTIVLQIAPKISSVHSENLATVLLNERASEIVKIPSSENLPTSSKMSSKDSQVSSESLVYKTLLNDPQISSETSQILSEKSPDKMSSDISQNSSELSYVPLNENKTISQNLTINEISPEIGKNIISSAIIPENITKTVTDSDEKVTVTDNINSLIEALPNANFDMEDEPVDLIDKTLEKSETSTDLSMINSVESSENNLTLTPQSETKLMNKRGRRGRKNKNGAQSIIENEMPATEKEEINDKTEKLKAIPLLENNVLNERLSDLEVSISKKGGRKTKINNDLNISDKESNVPIKNGSNCKSRNDKIVEPVTLKLSLSLDPSKDKETDENTENSNVEPTDTETDKPEKENIAKTKRKLKKVNDSEKENASFNEEDVESKLDILDQNTVESPENFSPICIKLSLTENIQNDLENTTKRNRGRSKKSNPINEETSPVDKSELVSDTTDNQNTETELFVSPAQNDKKRGRGRKKSIKPKESTFQLEENITKSYESTPSSDTSDNQVSEMEILDSPNRNEIKRGRGRRKSIKSQEDYLQIEENVKIITENVKNTAESDEILEIILEPSNIIKENITIKQRKKPGRKPKVKINKESDITSNLDTTIEEIVQKQTSPNENETVDVIENISLVEEQLELPNEEKNVEETISAGNDSNYIDSLTFVIDGNKLKNIKIKPVRKSKARGRKPSQTTPKTPDDLTSTENEESSIENSDFTESSIDESTDNEFKKPKRRIRRKVVYFDPKTSDSELTSTENEDSSFESSFEKINSSIDETIEAVVKEIDTSNISSGKTEPIIKDLRLENIVELKKIEDLENSIEQSIENVVNEVITPKRHRGIPKPISEISDNFDQFEKLDFCEISRTPSIENILNEVMTPKTRRGKKLPILDSPSDDLIKEILSENIDELPKIDFPKNTINESIENVVNNVQTPKKRGRKIGIDVNSKLLDDSVIAENNTNALQNSDATDEIFGASVEELKVESIFKKANKRGRKKDINADQKITNESNFVENNKNSIETSDATVEELNLSVENLNIENVFKKANKRGRKKEIYLEPKISDELIFIENNKNLFEPSHVTVDKIDLSVEELNIENIFKKSNKRGRKKEMNLEPKLSDESTFIENNTNSCENSDDIEKLDLAEELNVENAFKASNKRGRKKLNNKIEISYEQNNAESIEKERNSIEEAIQNIEKEILETVENIKNESRASKRQGRKNKNTSEIMPDDLTLLENKDISLENCDSILESYNSETVLSDVKTPKKRGRKNQSDVKNAELPENSVETTIETVETVNTSPKKRGRSKQNKSSKISDELLSIENKDDSFENRADNISKPTIPEGFTSIESEIKLKKGRKKEYNLESIISADYSENTFEISNILSVADILEDSIDETIEHVIRMSDNWGRKNQLDSEPDILTTENLILCENSEDLEPINIVEEIIERVQERTPRKRGRKKENNIELDTLQNFISVENKETSNSIELDDVLEDSIEVQNSGKEMVENIENNINIFKKRGRKSLTFKKVNKNSFDNSNILEQTFHCDGSIQTKEENFENLNATQKRLRKKQQKMTDDLILIEKTEPSLDISTEEINNLDDSLEITDRNLDNINVSPKRGRKKQQLKPIEDLTSTENNDNSFVNINLLENVSILETTKEEVLISPKQLKNGELNTKPLEIIENALEKPKRRSKKQKVSEMITPIKIIISNLPIENDMVSEEIHNRLDLSESEQKLVISEIRTADEEIDKELSILNGCDLAKNSISTPVLKRGKKGKRGRKPNKKEPFSETNLSETEQNLNLPAIKITDDATKILDFQSEPIIPENKLEISLPDIVPMDEIPKTPTIVMGSSDSEDELPLSFLAKTTNDDEILNDISETPSILTSDLIVNNIPDEEALNDIAELINEKDISEKIDETILDISYDIINKNEKLLNESIKNLTEINTSIEDVLNEQNKDVDYPEIPKTPTIALESEKNSDTSKNDMSSDFITTPDLNNTSLVIKIQKKFNCKIKKPKKGRKKLNVKITPKIVPKKKEEISANIFCEICNKSFTRIENLVKHKRTLTHISKLSEIEARLNSEKQILIEEKPDPIVVENEIADEIQDEKLEDLADVEELLQKDEHVPEEINLIDDISSDLEKSSETFPVIINNKTTNLKLVDIINDVLDKPTDDINLSESILSKNIPTPEIALKRYKSMAERKSFDSDSYINIPPKVDQMTENEFSSQTNNQLLSKQLSLLENIIEKTNPELNYIEDSISYSSNHFEETVPVRNLSEKDLFRSEYPIKSQIKFSHTNDIISSFIKPDGHFTHFENAKLQKPAHFDESSQQDDKNNPTRKILNRDEELFLECCSLLKSGSEISNSKKSSKQNYSNVEAWVEQKHPNNFIQRDLSWLAQGSRVETPIGEPYVNNDWSNSNSAVSSEWLAQKAASPDQPVENNTLSKKENNNSENFSNIQFEDISLESSLTRNTDVSAEKVKENIPLDFHSVHFVKPSEPENDPSLEGEISTPKVDDETVIAEKRSGDAVGALAIDEKEGKSVEKEEKKIAAEEVDENLKRHVVSAFGGLMAKALKCRLKAVVRRSHKAKEKRTFISTLQPVITDYAIPVKKSKINAEIATENSKSSSDGPKKIVTKGAMKVFEGLKVSIPTQDLNLQEVLKSTNVEPKQDVPKQQPKVKVLKTKKNVFKSFGNKLGLKETKKKNNKKQKNSTKHLAHDVYDFEESEDSSSLFKNKSLTIFRNICTENKYTVCDNSTEKDNDKTELTAENKSNIDSESETDRYYDSVSFEENSLSNESVEQSEELKLKETSEKSLSKKDNQKKCMIMGRIFKNASKPKLEDKIPEIRDISSEENSKIVETFLDSYSSLDNIETTLEGDSTVPANNLTIISSKNKMSKGEMDFLFDKLLNENQKSSAPITEPEAPKITPEIPEEVKLKEKPKGKPKKRQRHHSDDSGSTDEFVLSGKPSKSSKKHRKHPRKPNSKKQNGGINLEQEMKECIGVAGRKSQRKCTSGKQNVLAEFWSSDESIDYAELVRQSEMNTPKDISPAETEHKDLTEADAITNITPEILTEEKDLYEFEPDLDEVEEPILPLKPAKDISEKPKLEKPKKAARVKMEPRKSHSTEEGDTERKQKRKPEHKKSRNSHSEGSNADALGNTRRKRNAAETLYYWSSTSDDELQDLIEVKPVREDTEEERPMQHGWIVGDSPKKLVTMLAQAKGNKKVDCESVKEQNKKSRTTL